MKEFWKTGLALVVLVALGSYLWFVERKKEIKPEGEREKVSVLAVDKAKAKEVEIVSGGETLKVAKDGSGWKVVTPFTAPADASAVDSILASLEKVEADEVVTEKAASLADYGLDKPSRTVSVSVEGAAAPVALQFGAKSPDGQSLYASQPGSGEGLPPAVVGRGLVRQEAVRPARPRPAARQARRRAQARGHGARGRLRARPRRLRRLGVHEAPRDARRPLGGRRPARDGREPAHGVGRLRDADAKDIERFGLDKPSRRSPS